MVLGAGPPIIWRNSPKTHLKLSTCSSHISTPVRMMLWKWLFTPTKAQIAMSYRFAKYVVSNVTTCPHDQRIGIAFGCSHLSTSKFSPCYHYQQEYVKSGSPATMSASTSNVFLTSSSARSRLICS